MKTIHQLFEGVSRKYLFFMTMAALVWLMTFTGCYATYGKLVKSDEVESTFRQYQFAQNYNYYYLGFESNPYAILGLDARYHLQQNFWKPMDQDTHILGAMVERMRALPTCAACGPLPQVGYKILAPNGDSIGVLYSCYTWFPVEVKADNQVTVNYPELGDRIDRFGCNYPRR
jgi:hypothetical protein